MLNEYYKKLVPVYFGNGKNGSFLSEFWICFFVRDLDSGLFLGVFWKCYWWVSGEQHQQQSPGSIVDLEISAAVKDSTNLSITKSVFDGRMETTITAEKDHAAFKHNSTDLWPNYRYFKQQSYDFSLEKAKMPEMCRKTLIPC